MITNELKYKILLEALEYYKLNQSVILCPDVQQFYDNKQIRKQMLKLGNINKIIKEVKQEADKKLKLKGYKELSESARTSK